MKLFEIETPEMSYHTQGTTIWIDMFYVPKHLRRQGIGSAYYKQWEETLPSNITDIQILAADTGGGPSDEFWDAMGFDYFYSDIENLDYEDKQRMIKYL